MHWQEAWNREHAEGEIVGLASCLGRHSEECNLEGLFSSALILTVSGVSPKSNINPYLYKKTLVIMLS